MPKGREELRRGIRDLIEHASREMDAIVEEESQAPVDPAPADSRPILRLVRPSPEAVAHSPSDPNALVQGETVATSPTEAHSPGPQPVTSPEPDVLPSDFPHLPFESPALLPKKGVCGAYFISRRCWEVPEAYCNTALQVCMMRECPVYHLNKDEMERRFAGKFSHFWGTGNKRDRG